MAMKDSQNLTIGLKPSMYKWFLQLFSYSFISVILAAYVFHNSKVGGFQTAKAILTMNALLIAVLACSTVIYKSGDFWSHWGNLFGHIPDNSPKKFLIVILHFGFHYLPLIAMLWLGWHKVFDNTLPLNIVVVPIIAISIYFTIAPMHSIYSLGATCKDNISFIPASFAVYGLSIWLFYFLVTGKLYPTIQGNQFHQFPQPYQM